MILFSKYKVAFTCYTQVKKYQRILISFWSMSIFSIKFVIFSLVGAEQNKGTGKWKLCPTVINGNVATPGTYSPPADAPSRNKKK
jgi:hypothetical protein